MPNERRTEHIARHNNSGEAELSVVDFTRLSLFEHFTNFR